MMILARAVLPYALGLAALAATHGWTYLQGGESERIEWQAKMHAVQAEAYRHQVELERMAREEEQRRQQAINEVAQNAQDQITRAQADAAAARTAADGVRDAADRLAARLADAEAQRGACSAAAGQTAAQSARVLADVLKRADERAGKLAAYADRVSTAGAACEAAYDALDAVR